MPISHIDEIANPISVKHKALVEVMDIYVPGIVNNNISRRNGMIYVQSGAGGSGKSNLLNNMMTDKEMYKHVYDNIWYFCPEQSFSSYTNHPFKNHDKVFHEFTLEKLIEINDELKEIKRLATAPKKSKSKEGYIEGEEPEKEEIHEIEYNLIVVDDFAEELKNPELQLQLNRMMNKARHLCCSFIFSMQSYKYFPINLRKQITYVTLFIPTPEEWEDIQKTLLIMKPADAIKLYDYVFDAQYNHLDIDTRERKFYKNFNLLQIHNEPKSSRAK